jgi:NAD+ synthase (glutamine-hydrolysing)
MRIVSARAARGYDPVVRLALCQMNATVGDIAGNAGLIRAGRQQALEAGADLVLFPELALTGYPPEDLLLREQFLADAAETLRELARDTHGIVAIVGFPERAEDAYNSAAVLADGSLHAVYRKIFLPNYGVFDEQRYFKPGPAGAVIDIGERSGTVQRVGLTVCEDIWEPGPPASDEALLGATLILNISASPYHAGKGLERERMFAQRARDNLACVAFCALVGGQDELLFDGHSFVTDHMGTTIARAAQFREELLVCDVDLEAASAARLREAGHRAAVRSPIASRGPSTVAVLPGLPETATEAGSAAAGTDGKSRASGGSLAAPIEPLEAEVYEALTLGLRDYVRKNGFERVVLGLSGGIDSALVACLAVDALGPERVSTAIMPSRFSSSDTQGDARALAAALGARTHELPIEALVAVYDETLAPEFKGLPDDLTEENLQARIRGNLLMALSNKFGWLVLATGNKSEMSVGYTTLYGDLAGGFAVIKDVPKTLVYRLCAWRNSPAAASGRTPSPIPASIIERAPSAELRPDQRDEDSLPPYELLDRILRGYIELHLGREQLIAQGLPAAEVERTIRLVDLAEYKRRQAPPGIKVTERAFGRDRRMPITNRYRG